MRLLVDTHLLLWQSDDSPLLTAAARDILSDPRSDLYFSVASLWELVIKSAKAPDQFQIPMSAFREELLDFGYDELTITADHVLEVGKLEPLHRDPFDRLLLAQARVESLSLLTGDHALVQYGTPVREV